MGSSERHPDAGEIVRAAREQLGTRFRRQGRDAGGLDCVGLILLAALGAGIRIRVPGWLPYRGLKPCEVEELFRSNLCVELDISDAAPGDILLRWAASRQPHLSLRTDMGIIEAHAGIGRVIERNLAKAEIWHAAWRFPKGGAQWLP